MIYLNVFLRVFKKFLKVVRGGKNGVKWGKMGVKSLPQYPHLYTTQDRYKCSQGEDTLYFNPLPHMPILSSSNSAANQKYDVINNDKWVYNFLIEEKTLWEKKKLLVTSKGLRVGSASS